MLAAIACVLSLSLYPQSDAARETPYKPPLGDTPRQKRVAVFWEPDTPFDPNKPGGKLRKKDRSRPHNTGRQ